MYAVIVTGGKQYRVEKGDVIFVEKLNAEAESEFSFDTVLAVGEEGNVKFGNPTVAGAKVTGKVVKNGKGKKLNILTYRPKKGSMRKMGHRQPYTKIEITEISSVNRGGHFKWHIKKASVLPKTAAIPSPSASA